MQQKRAESRRARGAVRAGDRPGARRPVVGSGVTRLGGRRTEDDGTSDEGTSAITIVGRPRLGVLPAPISSFVGRERETVDLAGRLAVARLVTLTGPPGVGKTRLSLRVAEMEHGRFAGGVWLVELASLSEPELVPVAVARAVGLRAIGSQTPVEALTDRLRTGRTLLVLDNCEHLLDACATLVEALLQTCRGLRVLATSREPLGLPGEVAWQVLPLTLPELPEESNAAGDRTGADRIEALLRSEAGRLFVERAGAVRAGFEPTAANARAIAQICSRLDGIPLAIEMAAARTRGLTPAEIAGRLDHRFALLIGGSRAALPRQRTLRAAVDWSYDLLTDSERVLLRRLSVFAGGWDLEAAEAIAGTGCWVPGSRDEHSAPSSPRTQHLEPSTLDVLASLVDKSLVLAEERDGEMRYRLLEIVREYAAERLRRAEEDEILAVRHRDWFVGLVERATTYLRTPAQAAWRARLEQEHDNIRAVLRRSIERHEAEPGLRLGIALWHFWIDHGYSAEGRAWLEALLALDAPAERTALRAAGLFVAAKLAFDGGDLAAAAPLGEESLAIAREVGDLDTVHRTLTQLGRIARGRGEWAAARRYYEEALPIRRELGEPVDVAVSVACLGHVARAQGDYDAARALYEESLELSQQQGHPAEITAALHDLGRLAHDQGRLDEAAERYAEALPVALRINHPRRMAYLLEAFAALAATRRQAERAQRLAGAAMALREASGSALMPSEAAALDRALGPIRRMLGEERGAALWAEGRAMSAEQAVELALSLALPAPATLAAASSGPWGTRRLHTGAVDRLSVREHEVAVHVARGLSNREVAAALVVSRRTVEWHVANLLAKLGLRSRAQLVRWVAEHGDGEPAEATASQPAGRAGRRDTR